MTFDVTIDSSTDPVDEGETYEVTASVTNSGSNTDTQDTDLYTYTPQTLRDSKTETIDPGDTVQVILTWDTAVGDAGTHEVEVSSDDDTATGSVTVEEIPPFPVTVQGTNSPVTEGESLTVAVLVENTGESAGETEVDLVVRDTQRDNATVSLENGQTTTVELVWETGSGDAGEYTATVASATHQATTDVTVDEGGTEPEIPLTVTIDGTNAPVTEGDPLCLDLTVENAGEQAGVGAVAVGAGKLANGLGTRKLALGGEGQSAIAHPDMDIAPSAYRSGTDAEYERRIWADTGTDRDEITVQVTKPAHFATTIESTNTPVEEGENLEVTATVENNGGESSPVTVGLAAKNYNESISNAGTISPGGGSQTGLKGGTLAQGILGGVAGGGDTVVDDTGLSLEPGESEQVTLEWNTNPGNAGDHVMTVGSISVEKDQVKRGMGFEDDPDIGDRHTATVDWLVGPQTDPCLPGEPVADTLVSVAHGPMRTGRFAVEIDGEAVAGWQTVTIPGRTAEESYPGEGDDPEEVPWGRTTFDDLKMERGVKPGDTRLRDWFEAVRQGDVAKGRKELVIKLLDESGESQAEWQLQEAWLKNYDPPELDASADGDVATESATIAYDKMERTEL